MTTNNETLSTANSVWNRPFLFSWLLNPIAVNIILILIAVTESVMLYSILTLLSMDNRIVICATVLTLMIGLYISPMYIALSLCRGTKKDKWIALFMTISFLLALTVFTYLCNEVYIDGFFQQIVDVSGQRSIFSTASNTFYILYIISPTVLSLVTFALAFALNE